MKFNQIKERDADLESRPARALWIEIYEEKCYDCDYWSRPARALWIEISYYNVREFLVLVEAREGLVD